MKVSIIMYLYIQFSMYFLPLNQTPFSMGQKNAYFKRYQKTEPKPQKNQKNVEKSEKSLKLYYQV